MKVLSLLQPCASLLFTEVPDRFARTVAKSWETRSWKPPKEIDDIISTEGLLIHSSLGWKKEQRELLKQ